MSARGQGLILVRFSAQREHFLRDTLGGSRVSMTKTALGELRSGRVEAPARGPWRTASAAAAA
jgi:hypothetical protein